MIETTSVAGPAKDFSIAPASRNICGFSATTSVATAPISFGDGLRRMPLAASARISSEGCGSITLTCLASSPCASQPDSIAPPIFPAPARTMGPLRFCKALAVVDSSAANTSSSRRTPGPITPGVSIETQERPQALCTNTRDTAYGSRLALAELSWAPLRTSSAGTTLDLLSSAARRPTPYASPSVSNIAALMASGAVLPAQTTNWNAG